MSEPTDPPTPTPFAASVARVADGGDAVAEATALVAEMTLDEKLGCLDGDLPFWPGLDSMLRGGYNTTPFPAAVVDRLGIPGLHFVDGPRGCVVGPATTFPVSMARGASFDPGLERRIGQAIGRELRAVGATYTGAVCMNLLRHPAWGRAQETYGEDPHHVGELAAALTKGLQEHVMACMKHYALNSMENARFRVDVTVDDRALHEVYLPHFRRVAEAGVASVMNAYNKVNGDWCGESEHLLVEILRDDWGWDGFVITDFILGLRDPIASLTAGCHVEMPFQHHRAITLTDAVADGRLDESVVDRRVAEVVATFLRFAHVYTDAPDPSVLASDEHRALAREAAIASTVLVRNDGLLPLDATGLRRVAVLGELADRVSLGDGGSSNVAHTPDPVSPLDGLRSALPGVDVVHSDRDVSITDGADVAVVVVGYTKHDEGEYLGGGFADVLGPLVPPLDHPVVGTDDPELLARLGALLAGGAGDGGDGETGGAGDGSPATGGGMGSAAGGDRRSLRLRPEHEELIVAACAAHDRVVVAVVAGSAVVMPWLDRPAATLISWYAGSEGGAALADMLLGAEPGGRLPFAIPVDESDLVPFDPDASEFTYDLLHGQWWLDHHGVDAHLPFGWGLGYASFEVAEAQRSAEDEAVSVAVANVGDRAGSTVVQVYGSVPASDVERPRRRLVGFRKVALAAGASARGGMDLDLRQHDNRRDGAWVREDHPIELSVGQNAAATHPVT
ncbi:MAG: glycoside hydrolase family 3 N-terminal domain-containing protein [Actinomycetota bacterium]